MYQSDCFVHSSYYIVSVGIVTCTIVYMYTVYGYAQLIKPCTVLLISTTCSVLSGSLVVKNSA